MAIPGTGAISFSQIQTEFGGANPISLSEYYAGGLNTPTGASGTNGAVPGSGAVSISKYYGTQKIRNIRAIFGYGQVTNDLSMTNLVSNAGVVAADTAGVGTAKSNVAAAGYGGDKAIFGYGSTAGTAISITNRVSNLGVVASDTAGVGTARTGLAAAGYGGDRAIFGFGLVSGITALSMTNLVSNAGVVAADTAGVGTARSYVGAAGYGVDKAIFGFGAAYVGPSFTYTRYSITNRVSNLGVVASDTAGVGTTRAGPSAAGYGGDKAIFGYGTSTSGPGPGPNMTNLVSNLGVVAADTAGVATQRNGQGAAGYGGDKAIFGFGKLATTGAASAITNLVSNTGVVAGDTAGVGTARGNLAAATFG